MPVHDARSVLVVSHEPSLRDIYRLLFYSAGYEAHSLDLQDFSTLNGQAYDVVVIDHTLSRQERKAAVQAIKGLMPKARTVAIHASGMDCGADLVIDSREGAGSVLEAVEKCVGRA